MPKAIAKIDGVALAESDVWETVEGNVYVCLHGHLDAEASLTQCSEVPPFGCNPQTIVS